MPNHFHAIIEIIEKHTTITPVGVDLCVYPEQCPEQIMSEKTNNILGEHIENNLGEHGENNLGEHIENNLGEHTGSPLHRIVQWFKTMTTNEYIRRVKTDNWTPFSGKLWQRNYYEHIIRNEKELNHIRKYIMYNPMKWELDDENPNRQGNS